MVNRRGSSPRAQSPPPRSNAAKHLSEDRSRSPFQQIEKIVTSPASAYKQSRLHSAYSKVQDKPFLLLLIASFAAFFVLEYTGHLQLTEEYRALQSILEKKSNPAMMLARNIVHKHVSSPVSSHAARFQSICRGERCAHCPRYDCSWRRTCGLVAHLSR